MATFVEPVRPKGSGWRKRLTPDFSTWLFGIGSIVWYLMLVVVSHNTDTDAYSASIAAVGMAIAVYYGLSGISCIVYFRRFLFKSVKNFVMIGFLPGFGGLILLYVFGKTVWDARNADHDHCDESEGTPPSSPCSQLRLRRRVSPPSRTPFGLTGSTKVATLRQGP